jgi:hypothetical protein
MLACVLFPVAALASHPLPNQIIDVVLNGQDVLDAAGKPGAGDQDATGAARLERDHQFLRWQVSYRDVGGDTIAGLHLHGLFGNFVQQPFINFPLPADRPLPGGTLSGVMSSADDPGLLTKMEFIFSGAAQFSLDLHTAGAGGFPGGAIAGPLPEPAGAAGLIGLAAVAMRRRGR